MLQADNFEWLFLFHHDCITFQVDRQLLLRNQLGCVLISVFSLNLPVSFCLITRIRGLLANYCFAWLFRHENVFECRCFRLFQSGTILLRRNSFYYFWVRSRRCSSYWCSRDLLRAMALAYEVEILSQFEGFIQCDDNFFGFSAHSPRILTRIGPSVTDLFLIDFELFHL